MNKQNSNYFAIGLILFLALLINILMFNHNTLDFQIHDTYFVISKFHLTLLVVGPITFFLFLWLSISNGFKDLISNIGLIAGAILMAITASDVLQIL